jgi:hypothetical protein
MTPRNPPKLGFFAISVLVALLSALSPYHSSAESPIDPGFRYREFLEALVKSPFPLPEGNSVLVIGKVLRPGEVKYGDGITASKAIQDVGGLDKFARRRTIGVWKSAEGRFVVFDLKAVMEKKSSAKDPVLTGGDVVIVLENLIIF